MGRHGESDNVEILVVVLQVHGDGREGTFMGACWSVGSWCKFGCELDVQYLHS